MTRLLTNNEYAQPVVPVDGDGNIITGTGGASTVADGADATLGAKADAAVGDASGTVNAHLRQIAKSLGAGIGVTGTFYPTTQPVSGTGFNIPVTLTVTNGAYTAADVVGGLITFAGAGSAAGKRSVIHTIVLSGVAALAYELWFFAADMAAGTIADNGAFAPAAADIAGCKGVIPIGIADYCAAQSSFNVATLRSVGFEFTCVATTLYAYMKAVATTTPGTTTLTLSINGEFVD